RVSGFSHRYARREDGARGATVWSRASGARRRRRVQPDARGGHARALRETQRAGVRAATTSRNRQRRDDRACRTLSLRARRTLAAGSQRVRQPAHSRTRRRMTNPIVHHPFNFGIAGFNFTGFGIAVLLAFLISQIICERELARRGRDIEAAAVSDVLFAALL